MAENTLFPEEDVKVENVDLLVAFLDSLIPDLNNMPVSVTAKLKSSVKTLGVLEPILLIHQKKGNKYDIADGRRRCRAAVETDRKSIPARIFPYGWTKGAVITLVGNDARTTNPLAEWKAINELLDDDLTEAQITDKTGVSPQRIKQLLTLNELVPKLKKAFEGGDLKPAIALLCAKQKRVTQQRLVEILEENGKLKSKDVADVRRVVRSDAQVALPASLFAPVTETWHDGALASLDTLSARLESAPEAIKVALNKLIQDVKTDKPQG